MTELTRTINNVNDITSLQEIVNNNTTNISTLQSYTVLNGTNFGVGPGVLGNLTTGTQNTIVGNWEDALPYTITSGSSNTFIGYIAGKSCEVGSNNTFVGANAQLQPGQTYFSGSIALGAGAIVTYSNQFVVASNVDSFIIPGLTRGGAGSGSGSSSTGPWSGGGGGSSRCLQKITIPVASGQVINFTIGSGGSGGAPWK